MKNSNNKTLAFMRRNAVYLILALCILAIGLTTTLVLVRRSNQISVNVDNVPTVIDPIIPDEPDIPVEDPIIPDEPDIPVEDPIIPDEPDIPVEDPIIPDEPGLPVSKPIEFIMPVEESTSIGAYSETMVFNSTLNRYSAHLAIDFFAEEGTPVLAVYDGTIIDVSTTLLHGTTIKIDHGNGLYTIYNSLADGDMVFVGKNVKQGDVIGTVSITNRQEYKSGAHLHFEVEENGAKIDPGKYLIMNEK